MRTGEPDGIEDFRRRSQGRAAAAAVILVIIGLLGLLMAAGCDSGTYPSKMESGGPFSCAEFWLNRYQTLIGGMATLLAAWVAFAAISSQMAQTEHLENKRLSQEAFAARSVLPFALDSITDYAELALRELDRHREDPRSELNLPIFPVNVVPILKEAIRFSADDDRRGIADLIATAQVVAARSRGNLSSVSRSQILVDLADLYARASRLFEFGRVAMDRHRVSADQVRHAFRIARIDEEDWPLVTAMLNARHEAAQRRRAE